MASRLFEFFLKYRTALPLCAFLLYLNTAKGILGRIGLKTFLCGLSFFILVQLSYIYDSLFRTREDAVNLPGAPESSGPTWPVFAAAAAPAAYIAWLGFWPMIAIALIIIPLYSDPSLGWRRLKTIPVVKSLVSVLNFWLVGVFVPVLLKYEFSPGVFLSALRSSAFALVFIFCLTILLDIRDVEGDRDAGIGTFPVLLGVRATVTGLLTLLAAAGAVSLAAGDMSPVFVYTALAAFSLGALKPRPRMYYEGLLTGVNLFLAGSLFINVKG